MSEPVVRQESNIQQDDPVETLPFRAVQEIFDTIAAKDEETKISINQVFDEFSRAFGKEDIEKSAQLRQLVKNVQFNEEMDLNYADREDPISVVPMPKDKNQEKEILQKLREKNSTSNLQQAKNDLNWRKVSSTSTSTQPKYDNSKQVYNRELEQQHTVITLFNNQKTRNLDKTKMEYREPIRLTYKDERPSEKEIERQRGDFDTDLTEEDRALESAQKYMKKYIDYVRFVQNIKKLEQIPTDAERALTLDNFYKYLQDARFYIKFYSQYSKFWAPEATRTIEPYKGLFIPVERRKESETFDFEKNDIQSFAPLKKLIFEDFHNRVRNGLPPSLDLHAQLPELARDYARVTFIPGMNQDEMESLFYPETRKFKPKDAYQVNVDADLKIQYIKQSKRLELNSLQQKFTNHYLQKHLKHNFLKCYDSSSDYWISITGEQFLQYIDELSFILSTAPNQSIFLPPCKNNKSSTLFYILILCAYVCINSPFILCNEEVIEVSTFKKSMEMLRDYFTCPILATDEENLLFQMNLRNEKQSVTQSGVKTVLFFGDLEPHTTVRTSQGSLSSNDPISTILKPSNSEPIELEPKQTSFIRFVPSIDTIADSINVDLLKNHLARIRGSSAELLTEKRQQIQEWNVNRPKHEPSFFCIHPKNNTAYAHSTEGLLMMIQEISEELKHLVSSMLHHNETQVLIYLSSEHPMFLYSILFCIYNSLSFSVAYSNNIDDFLHKLLDTGCGIVFADVDLVIAASNWIEKVSMETKQTASQVMQSHYHQRMKASKAILDHLDPLVLQLKQSNRFNPQQQQQQKEVHIKGFCCIGNSQSITALCQVFPQYTVYLCNISRQLYAPIRIQKVPREEIISQPYIAVETLIHMPLREDHQRRLVYKGSFVRKCASIREMNYQIKQRNDQLRKNVSNLRAPYDVIVAFEKTRQLELENQFYSHLESMLQKKQHNDSNTVEKALFSALLEEIQSILQIKSTNHLLWEDILQFVKLRKQLVQECLLIQQMSYQSKLSKAKSQLLLKNEIKPLSFMYESKQEEEGLLLNDVQITKFGKREFIYSDINNIKFGKSSVSKIDLHALGSLLVVLSQGKIDFVFLIPKPKSEHLQAYLICYKKLTASQWYSLVALVYSKMGFEHQSSMQIGLTQDDCIALPNFEQIHQMQITNDINSSPMRYYRRCMDSYPQVFGLASKL